MGSLAAFTALAAGEDPRIGAWRLEGPFFLRHNRRLLGGCTLFLNGMHGAAAAPAVVVTLPQLASLAAGDKADCWHLVDSDHVRDIPRGLLGLIQDNQPIFNGSREIEAQAEFLILANYTSPQAFAAAANRQLTYTHLMNEPAKYRGRVVHIEGKIQRVNRFDPPPEAVAEGVHDLYEAWIFNDHVGPVPYCVVFTDWPAALPRDILGMPKVDRRIDVSFSGYFYKKFRYTAVDRSTRDAPMLIGNTLVVKRIEPVQANAPANWAKPVVYVFMGLLFTVVFVVIGLTYWFRHTDDKVRRRLQALRSGGFVLPPPDASPVHSPLATSHQFNRRDKTMPVASGGLSAGNLGHRGGNLPAPAGGAWPADGPDPDEDAGVKPRPWAGLNVLPMAAAKPTACA
jgi:hypothetical protein